MAITVKHSKVSTIPDDANADLVRPSDWNADHALTGVIDVANGGTGASTLTGYVKGDGTSAMTAVATVPSTDITGLGTMSTQNANAVAITGGTINNATIGATTPTTGNFTTITGQTEVLRGTGQNLILQSQNFSTTWTQLAVSLTGSQTDPLGGSTAFLLIPSVANTVHEIYQFGTNSLASSLTLSIYAKPNGYNYLYLQNGNSGQGAYFNLSTGVVVSNGTGITSTITASTNGYYRCTITLSIPFASQLFGIFPSPDGINSSFAGNGTSGINIWGAQLEYGTVANTYIPTTTTAVYGNPSLSFSGVSEIGLLSNGALYLQPAGTGALQAQATTSTATGGNARGTNAVDWQTARSAATQVASGSNTVIVGGQNNTSNGAGTFVGGGLSNQSTSQYSITVGGFNNQSTQQYSAVLGGQSNLATGFFNFIGGGFTNSGTANAAVTTQSATMNATTAVTLSGSNANIKVGQYIAGTSIANNTYVAAISGTSLTLSQAASGSSTSTLSFFTPHGVVVGGGNNQATGSYSVICGGGDAGTAANRNVASGTWSSVLGGVKNTASGDGAVVCGGGLFDLPSGGVAANIASGVSSFVGAGFDNQATSNGAGVLCGVANRANSFYASVVGGSYGTTRGITGNIVSPACNVPVNQNIGVSQSAILILGRQTTDATATVLASSSSAASGTNQVILPNNSAYYFKGTVIAGKTGAGDTKGWTIEGVIKRGAGVGTTAIVGTATVTSLYADAGAATWAVTATADTTNGGLAITVTGQAATTIRWVAKVETTEMTF
jgi:hypothetical protein